MAASRRTPQSYETYADETIDADDIVPYPEDEDLLPLPDFHPFFALIEDATTGEHHHPTMHYIFSNDDPDLLTSATLRASETVDSLLPVLQGDNEDLGERTQSATVQDGSGRGQARERFIIVEMDADGHTILSAQSLASDWQVLRTTVSDAPSWTQDDRAADKTAGGLMLQIEGIENMKGDSKQDDPTEEELLAEAMGTAGGDLIASLERIMERFCREVDVLGKIMGGVGDELEERV
ncbi:hypothetical protein B0A49_11468 [Cryomyces minteri]|uniref:Uncharacterized protein n=1 Tax=Cryomyces minteri TaxID=331657 RepID=A0A4U0WIQ6_9PEZI|nr:hypothetical protein B0A49_11468 [Cryomyces minteri]